MPEDKSDLAQTKAFANRHRLRIRLDECGDPILPGRRGGHLYFADAELCAMWIDGRFHPSRLQALHPRWSWIGDKTLGVRDAWAKGIPMEFAPAAIRLAACQRKRVLSPEQREKLVAAGSQSRYLTGLKRPFQR